MTTPKFPLMPCGCEATGYFNEGGRSGWWCEKHDIEAEWEEMVWADRQLALL